MGRRAAPWSTGRPDPPDSGARSRPGRPAAGAGGPCVRTGPRNCSDPHARATTVSARPILIYGKTAVRCPGVGGASTRVAVGVAGGIATLQAGLVHAQPAEVVTVGEEAGIDGESTSTAIGVQLGQPGPDPVGIEDVVPGRVQRVGHIDPAAVPADLHHLRAST